MGGGVNVSVRKRIERRYNCGSELGMSQKGQVAGC